MAIYNHYLSGCFTCIVYKGFDPGFVIVTEKWTSLTILNSVVPKWILVRKSCHFIVWYSHVFWWAWLYSSVRSIETPALWKKNHFSFSLTGRIKGIFHLLDDKELKEFLCVWTRNLEKELDSLNIWVSVTFGCISFSAR